MGEKSSLRFRSMAKPNPEPVTDLSGAELLQIADELRKDKKADEN